VTDPRSNAGRTRGRPFAPGNPGKPKGARHKATLAVDALLDGEADAITRKAIEMAKEGDTVALRLCLDRIAPVRKDRPVTFALPAIEATADVVKASAALLQAVASGELTPSEAAELGKLVEAHVRAIEATEIEERLKRLEGQRP
jgi:hypothetical protein